MIEIDPATSTPTPILMRRLFNWILVASFVGIIAHATTPNKPFANPAIGDLTALVGFVLAAVLYFVLFKVFKPKLGGPLTETPDLVVGIDAADTVA